MNIKFPKFTGWVLLLMGILIILWSLYSSYNIFTAKTAPPEIFKIEERETQVPEPTKEKIPTTPAELQKEMEKMIGEQIPHILSTLLNLISWTLFAGISIFAGSQLANLGIKLITK